MEYITGYTPDIREYLDLTFYDWVTYRTNAGLGGLPIGRWLSVSHKVRQMMSYWVLTVLGHVISCVTVQRLTNLERNTDEWSQQMREYNTEIEWRLDLKDAYLLKDLLVVDRWNKLTVADEDPEFLEKYNSVISDG